MCLLGVNVSISSQLYDQIMEEWGYRVSWAIWDEDTKQSTKMKPTKTNMEKLHIFDRDKNPEILNLCNPNVILLGLNVSKEERLQDFQNFHSNPKTGKPTGGAYKLRYALKNSPFWGAYMTDFVKDYPWPEGSDVIKHLKQNPEVVKSNIEILKEEIETLGSTNLTIIVMYKELLDYVKEAFGELYDVAFIPHYEARGFVADAQIYRLVVLMKLVEQLQCNPWDDPLERWVTNY